MRIRTMLTMLALAVLCAPAQRAARAADARPNETKGLWVLANAQQQTHRFSTLFTAQNVRQYLSTDEGLTQAIAWCKATGVTRVFLEEFRGNYQADKETLLKAAKAFRAAGIAVSGGITTTNVGKVSNNWKQSCCYTAEVSQQKLKEIFEYAASLFDEVMIDDFWFTDCTCPECDAARQARTVTVGGVKYPVSGDAWEDYRCELLYQLSVHNILEASRKINPRVKIIIKYPQWYDKFHERGYDVARETAAFDRTWVGTELRDYADPRWGGTQQYEGYFIMRWLGGIEGEKCGGGWYDPYGTHEATYLEQARQTVLGGARESMLFCYGSLQNETGPKNVEALRREIPELLKVAGEVRKHEIVGLAAYKPANSRAEKEEYVFDSVGMLGIPLVPCHEFPADAPAAFFPVHALKDPNLVAKLNAFIKAGKPVLLTNGLAAKLGETVDTKAPNVHLVTIPPKSKAPLVLPEGELNKLRADLLKPFNLTLAAPAKVGFYPFKDGSWVIENFNDAPVEVKLNGKDVKIEARGWKYEWK